MGIENETHQKSEPNMDKVNLSDKLAQFNEQWKPKIVGELNGQQVNLVKFQEPFVWHHHDQEDELFLVWRRCVTNCSTGSNCARAAACRGLPWSFRCGRKEAGHER